MPWNGHCYHPLTKQIFEVLGFSSSLGVRGGGAFIAGAWNGKMCWCSVWRAGLVLALFDVINKGFKLSLRYLCYTQALVVICKGFNRLE